jgi:glucose/arabinose dehydrogenase
MGKANLLWTLPLLALAVAPLQGQQGQDLRVPAGFQVRVFAQDLENPRGIEVAPNGDVYVAEREAGRVRLLRDTNGDGRADVSRVVPRGSARI